MKNKNISFIYLTIIFILIIIILLLYKLNQKEVYLPNNNVNIFEIKCTCNKDNDNTCKPCDADNKDNNKNNEEPVFDEDTGKFVVKSNNFTWQSDTKINVFANPLYNMKSIIAPNSSNTYKFIVKNSTDYNLTYNIKFNSENPYNINMLYRLKNESNYLIGNETKWVTAEELILENEKINKLTSDTYYLEWKWFESENDTEIGKEDNVKYSLNVNITAEEYYE